MLKGLGSAVKTLARWTDTLNHKGPTSDMMLGKMFRNPIKMTSPKHQSCSDELSYHRSIDIDWAIYRCYIRRFVILKNFNSRWKFSLYLCCRYYQFDFILIFRDFMMSWIIGCVLCSYLLIIRVMSHRITCPTNTGWDSKLCQECSWFSKNSNSLCIPYSKILCQVKLLP